LIDRGGGKPRFGTIIRWNCGSYGASRVDGIGAGRRWHRVLAIGRQFLFVEDHLFRSKNDTMVLRGYNQPTSTRLAPERSMQLRRQPLASAMLLPT
jgi:hypothetical protein